MARSETKGKKERSIMIAIVLLGLILSGIDPYDRPTWWMEVFPVLIGLPILILTYDQFQLTPLAYRLITIHALILMLGGHYTYARVPLGFWIQDLFDFARNHYDRIGHFAQGFVPAIIAREVLLRNSPVYPGKMLFFLVACVCLAISASYEFIEWWAAIAGGEAADAFLGTQGDVWDTQWDMFLALIGSLTAQLTLGRLHDKQLGQMKE
jgi:putative membrane protein